MAIYEYLLPSGHSNEIVVTIAGIGQHSHRVATFHKAGPNVIIVSPNTGHYEEKAKRSKKERQTEVRLHRCFVPLR